LTTAYINRIATAVPAHDVHEAFLGYARLLLGQNPHRSERFERMVKMAGIAHRYSCIDPAGGFYGFGRSPTTAERMRTFDTHAPELAATAVERLSVAAEREPITHLLTTCCTGFSAPGLDFALIERCGLPSSVERISIGFMGCHAAINALKLARHIVRSEPTARVVVLNLELCTLHLRETSELEKLLSFLLFADGCAACLVTAEPHGIAIDSFRAILVPQTKELITWHIGDFGFEMVLSSRVAGVIRRALKAGADDILSGAPPSSIDLWAVHPGGTSVVDAVQRAFDVNPDALSASREVLSSFGNMSSATVMFVLGAMLRSASPGAAGCAVSFGPGVIAETMLFHTVG
jgi:predicted naringenin-chalcone synthase